VRPANAVLATLAYRLASYWLPLLSGVPACFALPPPVPKCCPAAGGIRARRLGRRIAQAGQITPDIGHRSAGDLGFVDDDHDSLSQPGSRLDGITLLAGPHMSDQYNGAAGDIRGHVSVVGKYLVAVEGLPDLPVDVGRVHLEAEFDPVFNVPHPGQPDHG
jgi:hypothetical protein